MVKDFIVKSDLDSLFLNSHTLLLLFRSTFWNCYANYPNSSLGGAGLVYIMMNLTMNENEFPFKLTEIINERRKRLLM